MIKPILPKLNNTELFCRQYWRKVLKGAVPSGNRCVYQHDNLTAINFAVLRRHRSTSINEFAARRMMPDIDKNFKLLKPTTEDLILWRGVKMPSYKEKEFYDTFNRSYNVKKGDIIHMPEYAYAARERKAAELYAPNNTRSILYEIEVPKGAQLSYSFNYIFPRYSRFECINVEEVKDLSHPVKHVKLKYILPDKI